MGHQSHPVEPGQQPEASLASSGVTQRTKRRQPVPKPCYGASRALPAASLRRCQHGGRAGTPLLALVCSVPPGSKNTAKAHQGSPGTWDVLRLHLQKIWRGGAAKPKGPWPQAGVGLERSKHRRSGWYGQAKATKRGRRVRRKSQRFIVPRRPGNSPARTRWREGGAELRNRWEETWPVHRNRSPC